MHMIAILHKMNKIHSLKYTYSHGWDKYRTLYIPSREQTQPLPRYFCRWVGHVSFWRVYITSVLSMNSCILMSRSDIQHQEFIRIHHKRNDFGSSILPLRTSETPKYQSLQRWNLNEVVLGDGNPKPKKPWKPSAQRRCHGIFRMPREKFWEVKQWQTWFSGSYTNCTADIVLRLLATSTVKIFAYDLTVHKCMYYTLAFVAILYIYVVYYILHICIFVTHL